VLPGRKIFSLDIFGEGCIVHASGRDVKYYLMILKYHEDSSRIVTNTLAILSAFDRITTAAPEHKLKGYDYFDNRISQNNLYENDC
jgi:hypothetical protein